MLNITIKTSEEKSEFAPYEVRFVLNDLIATSNLANQIAGRVKAGDVVCLSGDLGTGKTTFAKAFINNFYNRNQHVISPTFNILQTFNTKDFTLHHYDLYRIENENELEEIGIEESTSKGVCLIEWPDIARKLLPESRVEIELAYGDNADSRIVKIKGFGIWSILIKEIFN